METFQKALETKTENNSATIEGIRKKFWLVIMLMVIISKLLKSIEDSIAENMHIIKLEMQRFEDV